MFFAKMFPVFYKSLGDRGCKVGGMVKVQSLELKEFKNDTLGLLINSGKFSSFGKIFYQLIMQELNNLPFDNLGYPVLLSLDNGQSFGSGFRLKYKGLNFIITAKHVLFDGDNDLRCSYLTMTCQDIGDKKLSPCIFEIDIKEINPVFSLSADVAAIHIGWNIKLTEQKIPLKHDKSVSKQPSVLINLPGINQITEGSRQIVSVSHEATRMIEEMCIGNDVYIIGYPVSLG